MPRFNTHVAVGAGAGGLGAAYRARRLSPAAQILEATGGMLGGYIGGQLPDIFEPATLGPCHRSFCHSWAMMLAGVRAADAAITAWERECRREANEAAHRRQNSVGLDDLQKFWLFVQEMAWRIAAGVLGGLIAGYGSHLALDAFTPKCLPLVA